MRRLFEEPSYNYMTVRVLNSFSVLPTLHVGVCNSYRYARQVAVVTENVLLFIQQSGGTCDSGGNEASTITDRTFAEMRY